jgi:hypothetical protein
MIVLHRHLVLRTILIQPPKGTRAIGGSESQTCGNELNFLDINDLIVS